MATRQSTVWHLVLPIASGGTENDPNRSAGMRHNGRTVLVSLALTKIKFNARMLRGGGPRVAIPTLVFEKHVADRRHGALADADAAEILDGAAPTLLKPIQKVTHRILRDARMVKHHLPRHSFREVTAKGL